MNNNHRQINNITKYSTERTERNGRANEKIRSYSYIERETERDSDAERWRETERGRRSSENLLHIIGIRKL